MLRKANSYSGTYWGRDECGHYWADLATAFAVSRDMAVAEDVFESAAYYELVSEAVLEKMIARCVVMTSVDVSGAELNARTDAAVCTFEKVGSGGLLVDVGVASCVSVRCRGTLVSDECAALAV